MHTVLLKYIIYNRVGILKIPHGAAIPNTPTKN